MRKRFTTWLVCLVFSGQAALGQSAAPESMVSGFTSYSQKNLQEKVYIHTDKDLYLPGEIIWFKAYKVGAAENTPIDFSKIVYTEILDQNNSPVLQAKTAIVKGSGSGSFQLPADLVSGTYRIRSYTNWMKNYSPDYFFEKPLYIVNTLAKPVTAAKETNMNYDIQFFPEGGELVAGLSSKIGFKLTNDKGIGVDFTGAVVDGNNDTIARIRPAKFGIGSFTLKPEAAKSYRAVIQVPGIPVFSAQLPVIRESGYVMSLKELPGNRLNLSVASSSKNSQSMLLLVHTRQETKVSEKIDLVEGKATFEIDKNRLGDGISHITIFSNTGRPVAERLYFQRPVTGLRFSLKSDQQQYAKRKKVTLDLEAKDEAGKFADADASVSVYASNGLVPEGMDIVNYLWLKSDLKGNIEDPGYYFRSTDDQSNEALDNLMLTQGWRRFLWENVFSNKAPEKKFLPEIYGHIISGKLTDIRSDSPAGGIVSYLSVPGKNFQLYTARSDDSGSLTFYTRNITGPSELVAQTNFKQDSTYRIDLKSPFSSEFSGNPLPSISLNENFRTPLLTQSVANQVQNVYLGNKLRTFYPAPIDSGSFYLAPAKSYLLDDFVRFTTMEEVLREYVSKVPVTRQRDEFSLWVSFKRHYSESYTNVEPLLVYDGVPIFDRGTKIVRYDPKKVKSVEVLDKKYYHGPVTFNSIINFKSYKNNLPDFQLDPRATVQDYEGTQLRREFYAPVYETAEQAADRMPDFRNLLYWSPDVTIGPSGKMTLSFYTSDEKGKYAVVMQGISSSGQPASAKVILEVK